MSKTLDEIKTRVMNLLDDTKSKEEAREVYKAIEEHLLAYMMNTFDRIDNSNKEEDEDIAKAKKYIGRVMFNHNDTIEDLNRVYSDLEECMNVHYNTMEALIKYEREKKS